MKTSRLAILSLLCCVFGAQIHSFIDLNREYNSFEKLITQESNVVLLDDYSPSDEQPSITRKPQKEWTVIIYMASDNDLRAFAANNIRQMAALGSTADVNILAHLDIRLNGNQKVTRRYYIEKNKLNLAPSLPENSQMDSGDPQTLISCCKWAATDFPAKKYALIFWNHGTGIIDPRNYKIINPSELFRFNEETNQLDLDRSVPFLDFLYFADLEQRGVCWDNTTGNYLTNEKLQFALKNICKNVLKKRFSLIGFDACLMSMIEVANLMKEYADVMVGSQEVELGSGWNYTHAFQKLISGNYNEKELAKSIVSAYQRSYQSITNDFTQSAIDLRKVELLEKNVNQVAQLLLEAIRHQHKQDIVQAIKASKNRKNCTHFDEPTYIDLYHFYSNLEQRIQQKSLVRSHRPLVGQLHQKLKEGKVLITQVAFSSVAGKHLSKAHGISIYFPEQRVHPSYVRTPFAKSNAWASLINQCK